MTNMYDNVWCEYSLRLNFLLTYPRLLIELTITFQWRNCLFLLLRVAGNFLDMLHSFLTNCLIAARVGNVVGEWKPVLWGVLQGPVWGPLIFLIFINHLIYTVTSDRKAFGDDKKIFLSSSQDDFIPFQTDIDRLSKTTLD